MRRGCILVSELVLNSKEKLLRFKVISKLKLEVKEIESNHQEIYDLNANI